MTTHAPGGSAEADALAPDIVRNGGVAAFSRLVDQGAVKMGTVTPTNVFGGGLVTAVTFGVIQMPKWS